MRERFLSITILLIAALIITACGLPANQANQPSKPQVSFKGPPSGTTLKVGEQTVLRYSARDVQGVSQIELLVNGAPIQVQPIDPPINTLSAGEPWTPTTPGSYVVELRAFNVNNEPSDPAQIFLTVEPITETVAESPPELPTPTATLVIPTDTPVPSEPVTPTEEPTLTPTLVVTEMAEIADSDPSLTVVAEAIFVRGGPGAEYPELGKLNRDETARVIGQDVTGDWWQIVYPPDSNQRGWVSADPEFTAISDPTGVALVQAPPLPTPTTSQATDALPTYTPTPAESSEEPVASADGRPVIHSFTANQQQVSAGEEVLLSWELSEATEAYLRYDETEEGVISPGEKRVFPQQETTYTLIARNDAGETTASLTIGVDTSAPALSPPAIYYFAADRYEIDKGDDVVLSWDLGNATEAYLYEDEDDPEGVVAPGSETVSPDRDTVYTIEAINPNGKTYSELKITLGRSDAADGSSTPTINSFSADRLTIKKGESVTLRWSLENATEAYLQYEDEEQGVVSPGEKVVSPNNDTRYLLIVHNKSGETVSELTIRVE